MHSGIDPKQQLAQYNIPVVCYSPVGQNLRDHYFTSIICARTDSSTDRKGFYGNQAAMDSAWGQWKRDQTGGWAKFACTGTIGFFKSDPIATSDEFKTLPANVREHLSRETIPHFELISHAPPHWMVPNFPQEHLNSMCLACFVYNTQGKGNITLQSSDSLVPLKFDPKVLSGPYDRRVAIESLRELLRIVDHPDFAKDTLSLVAAPLLRSDTDLLDSWRNSMQSSWHMTGTAKMGTLRDSDAVVDSNFRVIGIENLRVADMSVVPVLPSGHTQPAAYVTGTTCSEMLIEEYDLA
jgi:choline dehydrogenase-like flavoprotein